jgi:hypothetical protein
MVLTRWQPERNIFLDRSFCAVVHAYPVAGDDINQLRPIMNMVIRSPARRQNRVAESEFLDSFFVRSKEYLDSARVRRWNLYSGFFPSSHDFQVSVPFERFLVLGSKAKALGPGSHPPSAAIDFTRTAQAICAQEFQCQVKSPANHGGTDSQSAQQSLRP